MRYGGDSWPSIDVLAYETKGSPRVAVVRFKGDYELSLGLFKGVDLQEPIGRLWERGYRFFVLDFNGTNCFDHCYGDGPISYLMKQTRGGEGAVRLVLPMWLSQWFEMIGWLSYVQPIVLGSVEECIASLKATPEYQNSRSPAMGNAPNTEDLR